MLSKLQKSKKLIYLDHAATTPLDPRVKKAMQPFWENSFGNPSSLYRKGREADLAVRKARETIAGLVNAKADEIVFTAGGTESVNLAIFGVARNYKPTEKKKYHLVASAIEHHAVLHSLDALKQEGFDVNLVQVDECGFVKLDELEKALRPETVLVSIMYANNEIGTVEPIAKIGKWLKAENEKRKTKNLPQIIFHVDACQAAGSLNLDVNYLGVDLLSANGSKMYGPKQVGFLYVRSGTEIKPLIYGGGQEKGVRSGTENVPGIVGLAESFALAQKQRVKENQRLTVLRDYFIEQLFKKIPNVILNGPDERGKRIADEEITRLPNNVNISFPGVEGETLLLYLDSYNIAVSTGSACTTGTVDPSHVIEAIGHKQYARQTIRFSLGKETSKKDIDYVLKVLPGLVAELRRVETI